MSARPHALFRRRGARARKGVAAVELAMILPAMMILLFGAIEAGRMYYAWNTVRHGVDEVTRFASVQQTFTEAEAINLFSQRTTGVDMSNVTLVYSETTVNTVVHATVSATYRHVFMVPILMLPPINITTSNTMPRSNF
ncbi:MAG: pilus assembly protein [Alphaproteobacteria bacterium]|nr:pilus assembly protein [Alphaproteobacteria bacterium]